MKLVITCRTSNTLEYVDANSPFEVTVLRDPESPA